MRIAWLIPWMMATAALGQTAPSTRLGPATSTRPAGTATLPAPVPPPATRAGQPKNIDKALEGVMSTVDAEMGLADFVEMVRLKTQTNLVVNWNALGQAGVTRETAVSLHVKELTYEQVVRTLMEVLPATGTKANYSVSENTLEITTNAEIGKGNVGHLYDLGRAVSYSFNTPVTHEEQEHNILLVAAVLRAELVRAGEPLDAKGHELSVKDGVLLATVSERGQAVINRMVNMFNQPIKVGQMAGGTQYTAFAKRAQDAYTAFLAKPETGVNAETWRKEAPVRLAQNPAKYPQFNVAPLPGTREELAKASPEIMVAVSDSGVLLVGPAEAVRARTMLAVYDLREVMKKVAAKSKMNPPPAQGDLQKAIVQVLQTSIKPEGQEWAGGDDLEKKPAVMIPYSGLLVVFATASTHRTMVAALQDMNK